MKVRLRPLAGAYAIGAAAMFLLAGYEFARSASQSLFIQYYGARRLPVVLALSPLATLAMVYGYGWVLSRLGARRTLAVTTSLSGLGLGACYAGVAWEVAPAAGALYVLREAYVVLLIEQYWSFINSTLNQDQARRANGPICGVASVGGIAGGAAVSLLAERLGTEAMVLFAAASSLPAALCGMLAYRLGGEPQPTEARREGHGKLALDLLGRYATLRLVGAMVVTTQVLSTVLDLRFSGLLEVARPDTDVRTAYVGAFWSRVNAASFALQFVAVPLILRHGSLRRIHGALPMVHLVAAAALLLHPSLTVGAAALLTFKALDYSVFRAAKEILYMPLPFDARYRAKEVIDAFGYRAAKGGIASLLAVAGAAVRELPAGLYPATAFAAAATWLALVLWLLPPDAPKPDDQLADLPDRQESDQSS